MAFSRHQRVDQALKYIGSLFPPEQISQSPEFWPLINNAMDGMVRDGWLIKQSIPSAPIYTIEYDVTNPYVATNVDDELPPDKRAATIAREMTSP
jgi:hypothetical protein